VRRRSRTLLRTALPLAVLLVLVVLGRTDLPAWLHDAAFAPPATGAADAAAGADARLAGLFRARRSGVWVEAEGTVKAVLPDDRRGSRHQRLILETGRGHTVLVSHNIDLAPRVEGVAVGDRIVFRGLYEWNPEGGVVHWTHHDPAGRRAGGWLRHEGRLHR
jgi:hypothetical protein